MVTLRKVSRSQAFNFNLSGEYAKIKALHETKQDINIQ